MRILAVSDIEAKYYYDYYTEGKLSGFDLILACGDLKREYLEFLVTMAHCPVVYVHGNHDERFDKQPPEGCVCADGQLVVVNGVRILGLGGSHKYRDAKHMYTEQEMRLRILRVMPQLWLHRGFDILLTHAPARNINDFDSITHRGFECFVELMDHYHPKYFVHGHIHMNYGAHIPQKTQRDGTTIINAYDHCAFDYEDPAGQPHKKSGQRRRGL